MDAVARWLTRHPVPVVVANLLLGAVLGVVALGIRIENSLESMLPAGDPAVEYYNHTRAIFGSDDVAVVGMRTDDLFTPAALTKVARVTDALAHIEGVDHVVSVTNAVDPAADVVNPPRLLPRIPPLPDDIAALREKLRSTPLYAKNLVADDARGAAITVFFRTLTDAQYLDLGVDAKIRAVLAAESTPERFFYTGAAHVKQAAVELMRRDLVRFTPIALGLVIVVLWISFGTIRGVALPILSVGLALVCTLGVMALAGKSITLGTSILPPLLLVVGSSYAIHVMARYYEQVTAGAPRDELVVRAFQRVWLPLVISAFTTAVGFASLCVFQITAIRDLGVFAVVGVVFLTLTSLSFLPATLQILPPALRSARSGRTSPLLTKWLSTMGQRAYGSRGAILWISAALGLVTLLGAFRIRVDSDFLYYFDPRSEVRRDNEEINAEIVGSNPFYIVIEGGTPDRLRHWDVLKNVKDLQTFLRTLPGITSSISLVDYLELLESGLARAGEGDLVLDEQGNIVPAPHAQTFWEDPKSLEPVLALVATSPDTFRTVVNRDFSMANVVVRTNLSGSKRIEDTLDRIRTWVAEHFPRDLPAKPTGTLVLMSGTTTDIVWGQIESLAIALGVIFVVMALMFISAKIGFLAIVPNVLPIVIFFGVMGWLGVLLNLGTSLIAAIALGIVVDSTIHYMSRLNLELRGEIDQAEALARTLRAVGVPIVYTTVALFFGFLTFALSSFVPIKNFGILAGVTMLTSLGANLVLLPALLATTKIITLWDLVGVKLGEDPARTIPLFAGLGPRQARIVVLMGEMRRFGAGETIVRRGEQGDEMFVIIQGNVDVWAGNGVDRRRVASHRRGDVFGEMGLIRHDERSADVVAVGPVETLAVDRRFLDRIQRRYPRIAARVFLNLTHILSDRLQRMTDLYVGVRTAHS